MASKLDFILQVFEKHDFRHLKASLPGLKERSFRESSHGSEALVIYKSLGGIQDEFLWSTPQWHLEFEALAIKLDEEPNFNRYRGITLKSGIYNNSKFFNLENYKRFCRQYELDCLKAAKHKGMWTDAESEKAFGESQESGDLALKGAAKWKQRAFEDFLEDAVAAKLKLKLVRISIYENIMVNNKLVKLSSLLISRNEQNEKYLWNYLSRRIS